MNSDHTVGPPLARLNRVARARRHFRTALLFAPALAIYLTVYMGGLVLIGVTSVDLKPEAGKYSFTLTHYEEALTSTKVHQTIGRTVRISVITVALCFLFGFPVARYITSPTARWRAIVLMCVLSPLMVSSVGRIFGWIALFGPGSAVAAVSAAGFGTKTTGLLYTEFAMVIGMTNLLLPFMVLSIAASRAHLDVDLLRAASSLGGRPHEVLWQIEMPLILPGIVGGVLTVFSLSISNFATAALLGGAGRDVVAYLIYLDTLVYFKEGRGAALSVLLLLAVVTLMVLAIRISNRHKTDVSSSDLVMR